MTAFSDSDDFDSDSDDAWRVAAQTRGPMRWRGTA